MLFFHPLTYTLHTKSWQQSTFLLQSCISSLFLLDSPSGLTPSHHTPNPSVSPWQLCSFSFARPTPHGRGNELMYGVSVRVTNHLNCHYDYRKRPFKHLKWYSATAHRFPTPLEKMEKYSHQVMLLWGERNHSYASKTSQAYTSKPGEGFRAQPTANRWASAQPLTS